MNDLTLRGGLARILVGDVRDRLRDLPDNSVDCVVTSPPYWGLRDYDTGDWMGGDPACDHVVGELRKGAGLRNSRVTTRGGGKKVAQIRAIRARHRCFKCGAVRVDSQLGLEPTLGEHIDALVEVFAEVHRVLKPTGTLWFNYGDCYATTPNGATAASYKASGADDRSFRDKPFSTVGPVYAPGQGKARGRFKAGDRQSRVEHGGRIVAGGVLKPKDLCMVSNRLAIALQDFGWWVRAENVWGKTNPMPDSSARSRPAIAHEKVWLLTKSADADVWVARDTGEVSLQPDLGERAPFTSKPDQEGPRWIRIGYYYAAAAVRMPSTPSTDARLSQNIEAQAGSDRANGGGRANGPMKAVKAPSGWDNGPGEHGTIHRQGRKRGVTPRHVGQIGNEFLDDVGRGNGRNLRNYEPAPLPVWPMATHPYKEAHTATFPPELVQRCLRAGCPPGGHVLDPFGGTGTTALVALRMRMTATLIELNPKYVRLARNRIERDFMGRDELQRDLARERAEESSEPIGPLFVGVGK